MNRRPDRPEVHVLCPGFVVREAGRVVDASSTVTVIRSSEGIVVVDTGSPAKRGSLIAALAMTPLSVEDVDVIVNTHLHIDHCGGNDLFPEAVVKAHALEDPPIGTLKVKEGTRIAEGVVIMETPGHTLGSITVLVDSDRSYAICGDALPTKANFDTGSPPAIHVDRRLALESMERILAWADVVVPGHGPPFDAMRKK